MAKEQLKSIYILLGNMDASFWNVLEKSLKKKYKFDYALTMIQKLKNGGNDMMFFDEGRVSLYNFSQRTFSEREHFEDSHT